MGELAVRMSWAILASVWRRKASLSKEILEEDWAKRSGQDAALTLERPWHSFQTREPTANRQGLGWCGV